MDKSLVPPSGTFTATIDVGLAPQMIEDLCQQGFEFSEPLYTIFSAKKSGVVCTLYKSGKLTVQGKEKASFIEFYLEPHILKDFSYTYQKSSSKIIKETTTSSKNVSESHLNEMEHIGIDESGKGDFFGPLCIAGVFADKEGINRLKQIGVRDSKTLTPAAIIKLAHQIKKEFIHHIVKINPLKYNELIAKFNNLNHLLAWGHATTIEQLVGTTGCCRVLIDQFAHEKVVLTALKRKKMEIELTQRHRGEEDVVVAAASILARCAFVEGLELLEKEFNQSFPKGASQATIAAGRNFIRTHGREELGKVGKLHFKTLDSILR